MKKSQFRGYILEEILANLIRTSGYTLITKAPYNDPDLINEGGDLIVKGRGAKHQIDVMGELNWIPAFNYPLRLMSEAKFRKKKVDIDVIRREVGILADVNQNYFVSDNEIKPRYCYSSVIFSTSGFKDSAIDMAIAHQIQLADLSDSEYFELKNMIIAFTSSIFGNSSTINKNNYRNIRGYLKNQLRSTNTDLNYNEINREQKTACDELISYVNDDEHVLFIGMSQGGFMLLLKATNAGQFIEYAKSNQTHEVQIKWSIDNDQRWEITPLDDTSYKLSFNLPSKLHDWIFKTSANKFTEALYQKGKLFSKISIYFHDINDSSDYIFNLLFDKKNLEL